MSINLVRVVNQQKRVRSILLDKIDISQGNFEGYAQHPKQKIYVPYSNPLDVSVKGYVDLVESDEVLLAMGPKGVITGLAAASEVTFAVIASSLVATPVVTAASNDGMGTTTITGTTFTSVSPDVTYVTLTNLLGVSQKIPQSAFGSISATTITIADGTVTIGTPTTGWLVTVQANSKVSNQFTLT